MPAGKEPMTSASLPSSPPSTLPSGRPRFQRLRVLFALVVREMGTKFGRSAGGYFWAIAEPLGGIVLLSIAFSLALRSPPIGSSFLLFYATGIVPFSMYNSMSFSVATAIKSNKGLLNYPVVSVIDAIFAKFVLNFMTMTLVGVLLFWGIIRFQGLHVNLEPGKLVLSVVLAAFLGLGVGSLNCVLFGFFPTWKNVWAVLTRPLFILSGILFTFESAPKAFQAVLWYNPLIHIIGIMRDGIFGVYDPQYVSVAYVLGVSGVLFVIGAWLARRHASYLIEQ